MSNIGIVGSNGFIGKQLAFDLNGLGHNIFRYNRENPIVGLNNSLNMPESGLDAIVWAAARVNPITASIGDQVDLEYREWMNFLQLWKEFEGGIAPLIYLSSGGCVYTDLVVPFTEKSVAKGTNAYGQLKLRIEDSIMQTKTGGTILRLSNVYGKGQMHGRGQGVIAEWKYRLNNELKIPLIGSPKSFRDYIHINDVTEAIGILLSSSNKQGIFNLGSGVPTSLETLAEVFDKTTKSTIEFEIQGKRPTDRDGYYLDISKISSSLNWKPKIDLIKGILLTLSEEGEVNTY